MNLVHLHWKRLLPAVALVLLIGSQAVGANSGVVIPGLYNADGTPYRVERGPSWTGDTFMDSAAATGADRLHAIGIRGQGVSAAIVDIGYQVRHEAIAGNILDSSFTISLADNSTLYTYVPGMTNTGDSYNYEGNQYDVYIGSGKDAVAIPPSGIIDESHGTHVAGTVVGMAPDAGLLLVNSQSWSDASRDTLETLPHQLGLHYLTQMAEGHNVVAVNNSWGFDDYTPPGHSVDDGWEEEFRDILLDLHAAGIVPVFAAGNEGMNNTECIPAAISGTLSVGAYAPDGLPAILSNLSGKSLLLAPGVDINSAVLPYDSYDTNSGTSMASPHVTGAIALLASGARNASAEEIVASIYASADHIQYDGNLLVDSDYPYYINSQAILESSIQDIFTTYFNFDISQKTQYTLDEWRFIHRGLTILNEALDDVNNDPSDPAFPEAMAEYMLQYPDYGPLNNVEYLLLRVDKAYMHLTSSRMNTRADGLGKYTGASQEMLRVFGNELASDLHQDTADIFQRLDAQSDAVLAKTARSMSPLLYDQAAESMLMAATNTHRRIRSRNTSRRIGERFLSVPSPSEEMDCEAAYMSAATPAVWVDGHGSWSHTSARNGYAKSNGYFRGASFGIEGARGDAVFGAFGAYSNFKIKTEDGRVSGNQYQAGLYGSLNRDEWFVSASASFDFANYRNHRNVPIPGASFSNNAPGLPDIVLPGLHYGLSGDGLSRGFSTSLSGGFDPWSGYSWTLGPRVEGTVAYGRQASVMEEGGEALALRLKSRNAGYAEGAAGFEATKVVRGCDGSAKLFATAKVMGTYGHVFGGDLEGDMGRYGSRYSISPRHTSKFSVLPEVEATWKVNRCVDLSASYQGRFARGVSEHGGTLRIALSW